MPKTELNRMSRKNLFIAGTGVALAIYTAAMLAMAQADMSWLFWIGLAAAIVSVAFAFAWTGSLDEIALRAHVDAWFWGGLSGLALAVLLLVAAIPALPGGAFDNFLATWMGRASVSQGFVLGFAAATIPATLGYAMWWAAFWLRRR